MEGASARPVFWAEELMDIGFEKFFTSPVMIMELGRIFGMVSFETVMYGLVVYATRMLLVNVCGIMTVVVEESVKSKEPLPLLVRCGSLLLSLSLSLSLWC